VRTVQESGAACCGAAPLARLRGSSWQVLILLAYPHIECWTAEHNTLIIPAAIGVALWCAAGSTPLPQGLLRCGNVPTQLQQGRTMRRTDHPWQRVAAWAGWWGSRPSCAFSDTCSSTRTATTKSRMW
jgi:hypothetical protein